MDVDDNIDEETTIVGFDALPQDVVLNIFTYHRVDYPTLTALERTCAKFRTIINNEENDSILWNTTPQQKFNCMGFTLAQYPTIHLKAMTTGKRVTRRLYLLQKIHVEQRKDDNIFMTELGSVNEIKGLFYEIISYVGRYGRFGALEAFEFTDMAVHGLVELVQANIIAFLEQEIRTLLSCEEWNYHGITYKSRLFPLTTWQPTSVCVDSYFTPRLAWDGSMENTQYRERNKIVRRLAYRAGIPEILGSRILPYTSVWRCICGIILELLVPVCVHKDAERRRRGRGVERRQKIAFEDIEFHINRNAERLTLPYKKVYSDNREFDIDSDSETEIEIEMNEFYCSDSDDDDDDDDDDDSSADEMDLDEERATSYDDGSYHSW